MTETRAVLNLEWNLMLSYVKSIFLMLVIMGVLSVILDNVSFLQTMMVVFLIIYIGSPFAVTEKSGTDLLYASLGVGRPMVVLGRYLSTLLFALVMLVLANVLPLLLSLVLTLEFYPLEGLLTTVIMLALFFFMAALQLPVFYKLGYTRARLLGYVPVIVLFAVIMLVYRLSEADIVPALGRFGAWFNAHYVPVGCVVLAVSLVLYAVSYFVSRGIYRGKDL